jgi:predicted nucleotidyltransferase
MTLEELRARRDEIDEIARRHGVRSVRVFGSVVQGEADPQATSICSWSWSQVEA